MSWSDDSIDDKIHVDKEAAIRERTPQTEYGLHAAKKKGKGFPNSRVRLNMGPAGDSLRHLQSTRQPGSFSSTATQKNIPFDSPGECIRSIVQKNDLGLGQAAGKSEKPPLTFVSNNRPQKSELLNDLNASKANRTGSSKTDDSSLPSKSGKRPPPDSSHASFIRKKHSESRTEGHSSKSRNDHPKAALIDFMSRMNPSKALPPRMITGSALRVYLDDYSLTNEDKNWLFILDADERQLQLTIELDSNFSTGSTRRSSTRQSPSQYKQLLKTFKFEAFQSLT